MTFGRYRRYLQSPMWRIRRALAILWHGGSCVLCGSRHRIEVHHRTYKRVGRENIRTDLAPLCANCHRRFHSK